MRATVVHEVAPRETAPEPETKPEREAESPPEPLPRTRRLLVVCAHPFDATVTLGGVIAAFADTGTAVQVICMTHDPGPDPDGRRRPVRAGQLLRAARLLGAREATLLEHRAAHLQWNPPEVLATELRSVAGPVDAVLTIDAGAPGSHPDLVRAARAARRVASRLGCPLYAWVPRTWDTDQPPEGVITVTCDRARQRAAIGCHDAPGPRDPAQGPCAEPAGEAADATTDEPQDYLTIR
ncbi:PIG-L deacetylase family protein [Promicromonospora sukumoe]|uniref:PIG-L deacetylase family protein n=1 Tax=Promicromonospora sukumoe TaxID=88382 RepID=UPI0037C5ACA9